MKPPFGFQSLKSLFRIQGTSYNELIWIPIDFCSQRCFININESDYSFGKLSYGSSITENEAFSIISIASRFLKFQANLFLFIGWVIWSLTIQTLSHGLSFFALNIHFSKATFWRMTSKGGMTCTPQTQLKFKFSPRVRSNGAVCTFLFMSPPLAHKFSAFSFSRSFGQRETSLIYLLTDFYRSFDHQREIFSWSRHSIKQERRKEFTSSPKGKKLRNISSSSGSIGVLR